MDQKIMVIDDEEIIARLMEKFLVMAGFECEIFLNVDDARAYFNQNANQVSLAIIDINLENIKGIDLAREFCNQNPKLKIIISSGDHFELEKIESDPNVAAILRKPFNLEDFHHLLKNVLS